MKFSNSASHLPEKDWTNVSQYLEPYETLLLPVADALGMRIRCGERWPYIELYAKHFGAMKAFRLTLNYRFMENGEMFFELVDERVSRLKLFGGRSKSIKSMAKYALKDIQDTELVVADIRSHLNC